MPQAKRATPIKSQQKGPDIGTTYAARGKKTLLKASIPSELVDRINKERKEHYGNISAAHYLTGLINAFFRSGMKPDWETSPKK